MCARHNGRSWARGAPAIALNPSGTHSLVVSDIMYRDPMTAAKEASRRARRAEPRPERTGAMSQTRSAQRERPSSTRDRLFSCNCFDHAPAQPDASGPRGAVADRRRPSPPQPVGEALSAARPPYTASVWSQPFLVPGVDRAGKWQAPSKPLCCSLADRTDLRIFEEFHLTRRGELRWAPGTLPSSAGLTGDNLLLYHSALRPLRPCAPGRGRHARERSGLRPRGTAKAGGGCKRTPLTA